MSAIKLSIEGMSCQGCADGLTRRLSSEPGISKAEVSFETKTADVEYDTGLLTEARLSEVVEKAGFSIQ